MDIRWKSAVSMLLLTEAVSASWTQLADTLPLHTGNHVMQSFLDACRSADASSMVTAWQFAKSPSKGNQCGQCLHVQNLSGPGDAYLTVIDYKDSGQLRMSLLYTSASLV